MEERIQRLEQLARLFERGALTEQEFALEKSKVLGGPSVVSGSAAGAATNGRKRMPLPSSRAEVAEDAIAPSAPAGRDDQQGDASGQEEPETLDDTDHSSGGERVWRNRILFTCGMAALIGVYHSIRQEAPEDPAAGVSIEAGSSTEDLAFARESTDIGSSPAPANTMSCKQAMAIAAVATCSIRMHEMQAATGASAGDVQTILIGARKSLQDAHSAPGCSGSAMDGERAALSASGMVDYELLVGDIETAKRTCVLHAQEHMESSYAVRPECQ